MYGAPMNLGRFTKQAKRLIDRRGGTAGLKRDAMEVQEALKGGGSASDKAKRAAAALKDDGPATTDRQTTTDRTPPA